MPTAWAAASASSDFERDLDRLPDRQRPLLQPRRKRLPFQQLHHEKMHVLAVYRRGTDIVKRADVRMGEPGDHAGLTLEPLVAARIAGEGARKHLDRHSAVETGVESAMDLAHPAGAERSHDLEHS